ADRNRSHWSTSKTPSYTKSVSWQHHRNPVLHDKLQNLGDLDLLYFLVEDIVKSFETACMVSDKNPAEFNKICEYFFGGL
ncbi:hypothetical protein AAGO69_01830, partial [Klebsiella pneumoniae]|nr:hypothetical protein [Klebsiella pneumoniae]